MSSPPARMAVAPVEARPLAFADVYEQSFDFVWRTVRRLGVPDAAVDDAVQDVFVVVHRRLGDFEGRSSVKTWLFAIVLRVARDHRRTLRRKGAGQGGIDPDTTATTESSPHEQASRAEAVALLHRLLDELDEEKRAIFVLADLEEMPVTEIAEALGANLNTIYSRLRSARRDFEQAVARHRAREPRQIR